MMRKAIFVSLLATTGCFDGEEEHEKPSGSDEAIVISEPTWVNGSDTIALPDARRIQFSKDAEAVDASNVCDSYRRVFPYGHILNFSCAASKITSDVIYGDIVDVDKDEKLTCADYVISKNSSKSIASFICQKRMFANDYVVSLDRETKDGDQLFSFENYDKFATVGIGSWTNSGPIENRYPANIRGWGNEKHGDKLLPEIMMSLSSPQDGLVYVDRQLGGSLIRGSL